MPDPRPVNTTPETTSHGTAMASQLAVFDSGAGDGVAAEVARVALQTKALKSVNHGLQVLRWNIQHN